MDNVTIIFRHQHAAFYTALTADVKEMSGYGNSMI